MINFVFDNEFESRLSDDLFLLFFFNRIEIKCMSFMVVVIICNGSFVKSNVGWKELFYFYLGGIMNWFLEILM